MRPWEAQLIARWDYFNQNYELLKTFSVLDKLKQYKFIPGIVYVSYDAAFLVFKKK